MKKGQPSLGLVAGTTKRSLPLFENRGAHAAAIDANTLSGDIKQLAASNRILSIYFELNKLGQASRMANVEKGIDDFKTSIE